MVQLKAVCGEADACYRLGYLMQKKGDTAEAERYFAKALLINPAMTDAKTWLEYLHTGRPAPAQLAQRRRPAAAANRPRRRRPAATDATAAVVAAAGIAAVVILLAAAVTAADHPRRRNDASGRAANGSPQRPGPARARCWGAAASAVGCPAASRGRRRRRRCGRARSPVPPDAPLPLDSAVRPLPPLR